MDGATKERLLNTFRTYDENGDGYISEDELTRIFVILGMSDEEARKVFQCADSDHNGVLDYEEFIDWICSSAPATAKEQDDLKESGFCGKWEFYDQANDGYDSFKVVNYYHLCSNGTAFCKTDDKRTSKAKPSKDPRAKRDDTETFRNVYSSGWGTWQIRDDVVLVQCEVEGEIHEGGNKVYALTKKFTETHEKSCKCADFRKTFRRRMYETKAAEEALERKQRVTVLMKRFPAATQEQVEQALQSVDGHAGKAAGILSKMQ